jgi:hypothetical protein
LSEKVSNNKRKNLSSRINCSNKLTYERIYGTKVVNPHLLTDSDNAETPNESTANAPDNEDDSHKNMVIEEDKGKPSIVVCHFRWNSISVSKFSRWKGKYFPDTPPTHIA